MSGNTPEFMTLPEAIEYLKDRYHYSITIWCMRRWCRIGKIPASMPGGRHIIKTEDLDALMQKGFAQ